MSSLAKVVKAFFKEFMHSFGLKLLEEVNQSFDVIKIVLKRRVGSLDNDSIAKEIIILVKEQLLAAWGTVVIKYKTNGRLSWLEKILLKIIDPFVIKEINSLDNYQDELFEFLSNNINEGKTDEAVEWMRAKVLSFVSKVFGL